jgi:hypothetical protein
MVIINAAACVASAIPTADVAPAQTLSPRMEFDARMMAQTKDGTPQPVHVTIQSWGLSEQRGQNGSLQEIPLRGFYVAHLLSGELSTTIDEQTVKRAPGDYWTVKSGSTMQVMVLGEYAVIETTVFAKE